MNCNQSTLRPDDLISPCLLAIGHLGYHNGECTCTADEFGPVFCDAHRPPPPPDPPGACVLCHRVGREPLVTGKDGIRWHMECAS